MSNIKIYYLDYNQGNFGEQKLYRESELIDNKFAHTKCPVFNHKSNRTFIAVSPIDFSLYLKRDKRIIVSDNNEYLDFDEEQINSPQPVLQITFPRFLFWTEEPNIWFEFNDHPLTALKNNFIGIGGWFNLSNWPRNSSLGITIVDEEKPVIIKKGDPLFRISFYPPNLDSGIILKKIDNPEKMNEILLQYNLKQRSKENWKTRLFSKTNIKSCPFKFLYDK